MPIADLLGVQFDMQLLLKLGVSAAAVLFVSLAYRFYNSREEAKPQLLAEGNTPPAGKVCRQTQLPSQSVKNYSKEGERLAAYFKACANNPYDQGRTVKEQEDVNCSDASSAVRLPFTAQTTHSTGRRSPCFLQKLESSLDVGRELRHDLEHRGTHSTFHSKAQIKVEDANPVPDDKGEQLLPGKINNYHVHATSKTNSEQSGELNKSKSSEDLDASVGQNHKEETISPHRRKQSYLSAAEQSELPTYVPLDADSDSFVTNEPIKTPNLQALHLEEHTLSGSQLEALNLNLGNCLEALFVAKQNGQTSLLEAALGVLSDNYLQVLKDPNIYGRLLAGERKLIREQRMRGRRCLTVADMDPRDWSAGGQQSETRRKTSSAVYYYDDYKDSWQTLCLIPEEVVTRACAMCTMDNYLFVAVGCEGTDREMAPSKRVFCYNPLTSIWKEISSMNEARPRCKLAALEGFVYAIGGECLSSVERYDPRTDRWTFVAPLPYDTFAVAHHVAVCSGEIFVSGGSLRYMLLRYSPTTDTWRHTLLGSKDRTTDLQAQGRFLYRFDINPQLGISVYRYHTVAKLWYECSTRRVVRCPAFQCATMDGTIYCVSRQFTMRFHADEVLPAFLDEDLGVLSQGKGMLFPFVLSLPDKKLHQTSV